MSDLTDLLYDEDLGSVEVLRIRATGSLVKGRWVSGGAATVAGAGIFQPASGEEVERLPEGRRSRKVMTLWTALELRAVEADGPPSDKVKIDGDIYDVDLKADWDPAGGFARYIITRVDSGTPETPSGP